MSSTLSIKEAAVRWNLAERTVRGLCCRGKVAGAYKDGRDWIIPAETEKPADGRITNGNFIRAGKIKERLPLPVGVSDYCLASSEYYYVDKTLMLKDLIDEHPAVTLFTRPRRFGKTLNMDMIRTFFEKTDEDTSGYFTDKKIWSQGEKYRAYQGKYPVVYLSFKDVKKASWNETLSSLRWQIIQEYMRHKELKDSEKVSAKKYYEDIINSNLSQSEFEDSLRMLTVMMREHYGIQSIVIIDEYDTPIQSGYTNGFYDSVVPFIRNLLSACFKDNKNLAFGFLTGILRVAKESIFSGLNNLTVDSVLDNKYSQYFGFTENEIRQMAAYYGATDKYSEICDWYDGYRFGQTDIFNPWSVINYFRNDCEPRAYWVSTSSNDILTEILSQADDSIFEKLTSLVSGKSITTYIDTSIIFPQIRSNPSSVYSFLLVTGYLKVISSSFSISGDFMCEAALPNKEVTLVYRKEILQRFHNIIPQSTALSIEDALFTGNAEKLKESIGKFLIQSISAFDTAGENFYHGFMLGICTLFGNAYITSNRESGTGRYDIQLLPKDKTVPGIIIELKAEKDCSAEKLKATAATALKQINDKNYDTELKNNGISNIYKYGVAFSGKNVEIEVG